MPYKDPEKRRANGRAAAARYRARHPEAVRASQKRFGAAHPDRVKATMQRREAKDPDIHRRYWYERQYGLTLEERDQIFAKYDGLCHICRTAKAEHVDHIHQTGEIRGALCGSCNRGIGMFHDDPSLLQQAIAYLSAQRPTEGEA